MLQTHWLPDACPCFALVLTSTIVASVSLKKGDHLIRLMLPNAMLPERLPSVFDIMFYSSSSVIR